VRTGSGAPAPQSDKRKELCCKPPKSHEPAVRWNIASGIVVAWVITLPAAAIIAGIAFELSRLVW
jgi:phosphate/sulfate permease